MNVLFQNYVSPNVLMLITPFILVVIGFLIEKYYVARVAMFTNAIALYVFYYPIDMPTILGIIVNSAVVIGIIGGFTRLFKISMNDDFYTIAKIVSSTATGILLITGLFFV